MESYSKKKLKLDVFESVIKSLFPFDFPKFTENHLFEKASDEQVYSLGESLQK